MPPDYHTVWGQKYGASVISSSGLGTLLLLLPFGNGMTLAGLLIIGVGCAPIYPSLLHATPNNFGAEKSQSIMGMQMACAYIGTTLMPTLFGLIAQHISISLYPLYLLFFAAAMFIMVERVNKYYQEKLIKRGKYMDIMMRRKYNIHTEDVLERLFTPWGEALKPDHVLQEYPRPLMRRENYLNLNGYCNYSITKTPDFPSGFDGKILVPFSPESMLSGVERQLLPEEYLWYERRLTVSEHQLTNQQRLLLHFGEVDQMAYVYVNGAQVCSHSGGYLPFETDITDALQPGENTLLVRVQDSSDTSYHSRGKQTLKRGGMFYTAQSGI